MTWLDATALALLALSGLIGWRLGFLQRALDWIGLVAGLVGASLLVPLVVNPDNGPSVPSFLLGVGVLLCGVAVGQAVGGAIGKSLRPDDPPGLIVGIDHVAGSALGLAGAAVALWVVVPSMAQVPGWPARAVEDSAVAEVLDERLGEPPFGLDGLSEALGLPELGTFLDGWNVPVGDTDVDPPAQSGLDDAALDRAQAATFKVRGPACGLIQSGSGVLVAENLVVTNAHVVAGTSELTATSAAGDEFDAELVAIDGDLDLALIRVIGTDAAPLTLASTSVGASGAVLGYPLGGGFDAQPYEVVQQITTVGPNIYDNREAEREVLVVATEITQGNSGGPLVDPSANVVGVAFAVARDDAAIAYAVAGNEVAAFVAREAAPGTVSSGACL